MKTSILATFALAAVAAASRKHVAPGQQILDYLHARGEALHITAPQPVKAVYIDWRDVNWSAPQKSVMAIADGGYNVIILAFYLSTGPTDMLEAWASLDNATINSTVAYVHSKGAVLLASAGGSTEEPYAIPAEKYATAAATWAMNAMMDGLDFDLENLNTNCEFTGMTSQQVVAWMAQVSIVARQILGPSRFITHAPQAPYFGPLGGSLWAGPTGCYTGVWLNATYNGAPAISWLNTQYYNQGATCYTTYASLFTNASANGACEFFPGTSVSEIASYGIPLSAIVVGKYLETSDAGNGYVSAADLHTYFTQAAAAPLGWNAGVMCWAWETADSPAWISTIYPAA